ncbi:MAG TPA: serine/threonine-protein kinase, partial [Rhodothermales bacterium]|nr:serine/threonine-protein kinase [Rhodothermales bacterium]
GRPYLVLEYVEGTPLTAYADAHRLGVEERLRLFLTVCAAVQAAHQALVVHRDLKPGNILVTPEGEVKLLDFGIAKLLDPGAPGADGAPLTRPEVRLLTPAYAAPEQVLGLSITTATDVYALGVILYELLTGHPPYSFVHADGLASIERIATEKEPPRPSTEVGRSEEAAAARAASPDRLRRRLRGDLDTIVLHALQKDPARRYGTAAELADDLRRHLDGRPVRARPDTLAYRTRTFIRRHRVGVGLGAALAAVLLVSSAVTAVQAARLRARAADLTRERDRAERVLGFLLDLFDAADPTGVRGEEVTARELLAAGTQRVERELAGQPAEQAAMLDAMARAYLSLGAYDRAGRLAGRALFLQGGETDSDDLADAATVDPGIARSLHLLGSVAAEESRLGAADSLLTRALALRRRLLPPDHPDLIQSLVDLAWVRMIRDDYAAADTLGREALAQLRRRGDRPRALADALNNRGILLRRRHELDAAARAHTEALALRLREFGSPHYYVGQSLNNLAIVREEQGRHAEAESLFVLALPHYRQALGPDHPDVLNAVGNLAKSRFFQGDFSGADSLFRGVLAAYRRQFPSDHRLIALTLHDLGEIQQAWGHLPEAEALFREGLAMRRRLFGDAHREVGWALNDMALVRSSRGAHAEALGFIQQALALQRRLGAARDEATTLHNAGTVLAAYGRPARADRAFRAACATWAALPDPNREGLARGRASLEALHASWGPPLEPAVCAAPPERSPA